MSRTAHGSSAHLVRRIGVTVSYVICLVGSMIGVGVFGGTPISEAAGGLLSDRRHPSGTGLTGLLGVDVDLHRAGRLHAVAVVGQ
ncbi:hypothetical protein [Pseudactinotalea sp. Z1732]|uniref:hypothetical protein n=1 Tax=Micrococcales TaxID=85006 RepID=UPI003C7D10D0